MAAAILVTGSTGFLGSEFITEALLRGKSVIALARNNRTGDRVTSLVEKICTEKSIDLPNLKENLISLDFNGDLIDLKKKLEATRLEIEAVYHCAANMSYSISKVAQSFEANQQKTVDFYKFISKNFSSVKQFFYISTAFTAGINPSLPIKEELHCSADLINSYQMSKWAAEMSLARMSESTPLPLTIIRPSIIVGDRQTGRYSGKNFGFYMFIKTFLSAKAFGIKKIHLDLDPASKINIISVTDVVNSLLALLLKTPTSAYRIIHLTCETGTDVSTVSRALKEAWDFDLVFSPAVTKVDKMVESQIRPNKEFARFGKWEFDVSTMQTELGLKSEKFSVDERRNVCTYFQQNFSQELKREVAKKIVRKIFKMGKRNRL